jgi:hypothetical protein
VDHEINIGNEAGLVHRNSTEDCILFSLENTNFLESFDRTKEFALILTGFLLLYFRFPIASRYSILLTDLASKSSARNTDILVSLGCLNRRFILERKA